MASGHFARIDGRHKAASTVSLPETSKTLKSTVSDVEGMMAFQYFILLRRRILRE